jgi:hypothetical protein
LSEENEIDDEPDVGAAEAEAGASNKTCVCTKEQI